MCFTALIAISRVLEIIIRFAILSGLVESKFNFNCVHKIGLIPESRIDSCRCVPNKSNNSMKI